MDRTLTEAGEAFTLSSAALAPSEYQTGPLYVGLLGDADSRFAYHQVITSQTPPSSSSPNGADRTPTAAELERNARNDRIKDLKPVIDRRKRDLKKRGLRQ